MLGLHSRDYTPAATSWSLMIFMSALDVCSVDRILNVQFAKQMLRLTSVGVYTESVCASAYLQYVCVCVYTV